MGNSAELVRLIQPMQISMAEDEVIQTVTSPTQIHISWQTDDVVLVSTTDCSQLGNVAVLRKGNELTLRFEMRIRRRNRRQ